jgi:hypothetical protein
MPKVTKAGRALVPVAGLAQAINFQRNQLMIIQPRLRPAPQSRGGWQCPGRGGRPGHCRGKRPFVM